MHFQIFIPDKSGANPQMLIDVGLADFVAGANLLDSPGPCGENRPGGVVAWPKPGAADMGYFPDRQKWIPAIAQGPLAAARYWIGFWNDNLPTPTDLRRPYAHRGTDFELGDGNTWLLPEPQKLTHDMFLADDGSWKFELQRQFHDYGLELEKWNVLFRQEKGTFKFTEAATMVLSGLRINYRLTVEVQNELRLLSTLNVERALLAVVGVLGEYRPGINAV
jgi:hypothetical protein